ncbi:MAG: type II toxin-antitoxin system HipA family toxin [Proteobacteria bacterium]|nr:type II toxin-antitoxin system HipA family toxin [Pseudomonadota bacterium]
MSRQNINLVNVKYSYNNEIVSVGRLALKERKIFFEYSQKFLELGRELSPFKLPLKSGVIVCEDRIFDGIFGVFNDSLPDGWGRLLLDRKLINLGINPDSLTPLDRLCYVGQGGMGALFYEPEISDALPIQMYKDFDLIADECHRFQDYDENQFVDELLVMNGSSAGSRPKILVTLINDKNDFEVTSNHLSVPKDDWIIKFSSSLDPKDIGPIEYAYHLMAVNAGLDVPEARLFKSKKCAGYFGSKRFDRMNSKFFHMHTVSGLLHVDHRFPSLDYKTIMKATFWLTKDERECEKQFRHVVFNVLSHNRDDHAKNFSFLMDENGVWTVSPAYDLTCSSGPAGEHCTMVMGEGKNPTLAHILKLADVTSIKKQRALEVVEQVKDAILNWRNFADEAKVSKTSKTRVQISIDRVLKYF